MLRIAISDDEISQCRQVRRILEDHAGRIDKGDDIRYEIQEFYTLESLLATDWQFDVLFLDLRYGDSSYGGYQAAVELRERGNRSFIIFLTSFSDHQLDGYRVRAFRYLMKPIEAAEIEAVMDELIFQMKNENRLIKVSMHPGFEVLPIDEIIFIESSPITRQRTIHMADGRSYMTKETLTEIYDKCPADRFVCVHKSYVIHLRHVMSYYGNIVEMRDGKKITVGRPYRQNFLRLHNRFVGERFL